MTRRWRMKVISMSEQSVDHEVVDGEHDVVDHVGVPADDDDQPEPESRDDRRDERTRTRLREVEQERDALAEKVAAMQRRERDRLALESLPEAGLSMLPETVPLTEDGDVDEQVVAEQVKAVLDLIRAASRVHHADLGPKKSASTKPALSWGQVLGGKRR